MTWVLFAKFGREYLDLGEEIEEGVYQGPIMRIAPDFEIPYRLTSKWLKILIDRFKETNGMENVVLTTFEDMLDTYMSTQVDSQDDANSWWSPNRVYRVDGDAFEDTHIGKYLPEFVLEEGFKDNNLLRIRRHRTAVDMGAEYNSNTGLWEISGNAQGWKLNTETGFWDEIGDFVEC